MTQKEMLVEIENQIRSSMAYHKWVMRNLSNACVICDSKEFLQVHHLTSLYHHILGVWNFYGNMENVVEHIIAMHDDEMCSNVTLCEKCHKSKHPGRKLKPSKEISIEDWTVFPRTPPGKFLTGSKIANEKGFTLICIQLLGGIGWHILNGYLDSGVIEFNKNSMAKLLGKTPGTSFNKSLEKSLKNLEELQVLIGSHISGTNVEVHLDPTYLNTLAENSWFSSMKDLNCSKMLVFTLRRFLRFQSCFRRKQNKYEIGISKIPKHIGLTTTTPAFVKKAVQAATEEIPWASVTIEEGENEEKFVFKINQKLSVPIHTLRNILIDSILYHK